MEENKEPRVDVGSWRTYDDVDTDMMLLKAENNTLRRAYTDEHNKLVMCRNELCLKCGLYRHAYEGTCDMCRWRSVE